MVSFSHRSLAGYQLFSQRRRQRRFTFAVALCGGLMFLAAAQSQTADSQSSQPAIADEAPFLAENDAAMSRMMDGMSVAPTGDVDRDFVAMMVPHHQGAIDMAQAVLRHGHNEQLKRLAQEIIVTQQQEIAAMRLAVDETLPPSVASPTRPRAAPPAAAASNGAMKHFAMPLE